MALQPWEQFRGVTNIKHDQFNQNLLYGTLYFMRWAALQIGAFQNINHTNASGLAGGDYSRLRPTVDPRYSNGSVWETFRADLVWETGVYFNPQPTLMSGVFVNDVWKPTPSTDTAYEHYIDYPHGRVVFTTPIATTSVVKGDFAHRTATFVDAAACPWFYDLMYEPYKVGRAEYLSAGSGSWAQLPEIRRQLPVIGIEVVDNRYQSPYALGGGQWTTQDVLMYIASDNKVDRDQWIDVLSMQNDRTIWLPNRKLMKENGNYPLDLDYKGMRVTNPMQYPQLIAPTGDGGFAWTTALVGHTRAQMMDTVNNWLFRAVVRSSFTVILP